MEAIFASPPEPSFKSVKLCWEPDILTYMVADWLEDLQRHNKKAAHDRGLEKSIPFLIVPENVVELIFSISDELAQPPGVKYLTVDLFDRFMMLHEQELCSYVQTQNNKQQRKERWVKVGRRVQNQALLRILSCMQLASKLIDHYKVLTPKKIRDFLLNAGHSFTTQSILHSEMRVFKTLKFKVQYVTPLTCIETLLISLASTDLERETSVLYNISLKLLDVVYLQHEKIYSQLYWLLTGKSDQERRNFLSVECDAMYQAAAILTSAATIRGPENELYDHVMQRIQAATKLPPMEISAFSSIITQMVLKD